jgi:hypothetical protein
MQRLEVSGAVRHIYGSLGVKRLIKMGQMGSAHGSRPILYYAMDRKDERHVG